MQELIEFLKKKRQYALEQVNLMWLDEKKFILEAKDESKGMSYNRLRNVDYELYYRNKVTVENCDILLKSLAVTRSISKTYDGYRNKISTDTRFPHQSTSPIINHEKLVENSLRQELLDEVKVFTIGMA